MGDQLPKQETLFHSVTLTLSPKPSPPVSSPFNPGRLADLAGTNFENYTKCYRQKKKKSLGPRGSGISDSVVRNRFIKSWNKWKFNPNR